MPFFELIVFGLLVAIAGGVYWHKHQIDVLGNTLQGMVREHQGSYTPPGSFLDYPCADLHVEGETVNVAGRRGEGKNGTAKTMVHWKAKGVPEATFSLAPIEMKRMMEGAFVTLLKNSLGGGFFDGLTWVEFEGPFGQKYGVLGDDETLARRVFDDEMQTRILDVPQKRDIEIAFGHGDKAGNLSRGVPPGLACSLKPLVVQSTELDWLLETTRMLIRRLKTT